MTTFEKGDIVVRIDNVPVTRRHDGVRRDGVYRVQSMDNDFVRLEGSDGTFSAEAFRKLEVEDIVRVLPGLYEGSGWDEEMEVTEVRGLVEARPLIGDLSYTHGAFPPSELKFIRPREKTDSEKTVDRWMEGYGEESEEFTIPEETSSLTARDVIWARNWVVSMEDRMSASDFFDHLVGSGFLTEAAILQLSHDFRGNIDGDV